MKTYVCKCNNCGDLYFDTNPQVDQKVYDLPEDSMEWLVDHNCPVCNTDGYLVDVNEELEEVYSHTIESIEIYKYQIIN